MNDSPSLQEGNLSPLWDLPIDGIVGKPRVVPLRTLRTKPVPGPSRTHLNPAVEIHTPQFSLLILYITLLKLM